MIMLGKDIEAYSFIKFWLSKSRVKVHSEFKFPETFEGGPFFKEFTKNGQNKREDIFEKLSPQDTKKPFLTDWVFYFCLAIIKKNTKDALKKNSNEWKKQGGHFKKYKKYLGEHFQDLVNAATTCGFQTMPDGTVTFDKFVSTKHKFESMNKEDPFDFVDEETLLGRVMSDYLPILVAYLNKAPAVKEALTMPESKVYGIFFKS
jgi:hypothetical protein